MEFVALQSGVCIALRPSRPAGALAGHVFKTDAIDRAHCNAQLAPGAVRLNDCVHHLVAAKNGIGRASGQTQRAANAPGLVNHGNAARRFHAVVRVQGQGSLPGDGG